MKINRKAVLNDIRHAGQYNDTFTDKGIQFYEQNDGTNHSDKVVTDDNLLFFREGEYEDRDEAVLQVTGDEELSHDIHVGNDATIDRDELVKRDLHVERDTTVDGYTHLTGSVIEPPNGYTEDEETTKVEDLTEGTYIYYNDDYHKIESIEYDDVYIINGEYEIEPDTDVTTYTPNSYDNLEVDHSATFHEDMQVDHNTNIDGTLDVTDKTHLKDTLTVEGHITGNDGMDIYGTATVHGDMYVKGTSYNEHSEDLYVGADFINLRENSSTHLADGERAGIIIEDYALDEDDNPKSLGIVTGNDGTLRIGDFATERVYTDDDVTYYSDRELKHEVTLPDDVKLYPVGDEDPDTHLKEYYYISEDNTEAVATRADSSAMRDDHFLVWDADGEDIVSSDFNQQEFRDVEDEARRNTEINAEQDDRLNVLEQKTKFAKESTYTYLTAYTRKVTVREYKKEDDISEYFLHQVSSDGDIEYYNGISTNPVYVLDNDTYYRVSKVVHNIVKAQEEDPDYEWYYAGSQVANGNGDSFPDIYVLDSYEDTIHYYSDIDLTDEIDADTLEDFNLFFIRDYDDYISEWRYYVAKNEGTAGIVYPDGRSVVIDETGEVSVDIDNIVSTEWPLYKKEEIEGHITVGLQESNEIHQYRTLQDALDDIDNLEDRNIVTTDDDEYIDGLSIDRYPTRGSENLVTSGGIYEWSVGRFIDQALDAESLDAISNKAVSEALDVFDNSIGDIRDALDAEIARATSREDSIADDLDAEIARAKDEEDNKLPYYAVDDTKWDTTPTNGSGKPVTSGGIYTAIYSLQTAINTLNNTTIPALNTRIAALETWKNAFPGTDNTPTNGSSNFVTSGGVYTAIQNNIGRILSSDPGENLRVWAD